MTSFNHSFDWKNVKILNSVSNYNNRLISEMLHVNDAEASGHF